jgi:SAM-dependent methyltransferase
MIQHFDPATIAYYDNNRDRFIADTLNVDLSDFYKAFLAHIPNQGRILDLGCGSGRDTKFFVEQSYRVVALDASSEMVSSTKNIVDTEVHQMRFDEMNFDNEFDGVWACASLLHVPETALKEVLESCVRALHIGGVIYLSFKYGTSERTVEDRLFTDLNEEKLEALINELNGRLSISQWITNDARPQRSSKKWLNALVTKR